MRKVDLAKLSRIAIYKPMGIGDSLMSLGISSYLKEENPNCTIIFIGTSYPREVLIQHQSIDEYFTVSYKHKGSDLSKEQIEKLSLDMIIFTKSDREIMKLAKLAKVTYRIGFGDKLYTPFYCTHYTHYFKMRYIRRTQHRMLQDYSLLETFSSNAKNASINHFLERIKFKNSHDDSYCQKYIAANKFNLLIHPGAVSARYRNWQKERYVELINQLPKGLFHIILTGGPKEIELCNDIKLLTPQAHCTNLCNQFSLTELYQLITQTDAVLASSTGPLHIAALSGIHTLGIYPSNHKDNAFSWGPVGKNAIALSSQRTCKQKCTNIQSYCPCVQKVALLDVLNIIKKWANDSHRHPATKCFIWSSKKYFHFNNNR